MKCKKCNAELPDGVKFCTNCGEPIAAAPTEGPEPKAAEHADEAGAESVSAETAADGKAEAPEAPVSGDVQAAEPEAPVSGELQTSVPEASVNGDMQASAPEAPASGEVQASAPEAPVNGDALVPAPEVPASGDVQLNASQAPVNADVQVAPENQGQPGGAPVGAGAPYTPVPVKTEAAPSEIKEGKKFTTAIIGVVAAVLVVAIAAFAVLKLTTKDPKEVVISAFENISPEGQVYPTEELFGTEEFVKNLATTSTEGGMTLKLTGSSDETVEQLNGSGLSFEMKDDKETKEVSIYMGLIYNDMDFLTLDAYYGNEKMVFAVPELSTRAFTLDLSGDLAKKIKDSPVLGPMAKEKNLDVDGLAALFAELQDEMENKENPRFDLEALWNRYKEGCKAQDNFKAALTVTKGEKQKFTVDGKEVNCTGYNTVVSKDSMIEFLNTSSDFFLQDETLRADFRKQLEYTVRMSELMGQTMGQSMDTQELLDQTFEEAEKSVDEMIEYLDETLDDVNMVVYVDKKGRLAALDGTTVIHPDGEDVDVKFHIELKGGAYLTQNLSASIEMEDDSDTVTVDILRNGEYDGSNLTDDLSVDMGVSTGDSIYFTYTATYAKDDGSYHVGMDLGMDGKKLLAASLSGAVDELEKGESFHMDIDELKISMEDTDYVTMSGEYYVRPLEGAIEVPEGETMDVLSADMQEWNTVVEEIFGNVWMLVLGLY